MLSLSKKITLLTFLFTCFILDGCLVGNKIVYEVNLTSHNKGTATVIYTNIRSNALGGAKLEEDKNILFSYMLKSDKFVDDMKKEGKEIISRDLFLEDGKLNGKATYRFSKLSDVENLSFEDRFYFVTLSLEDSVISTNGLILKSSNYKRIMWDSTFNTLKFEILTEPADSENLTDLAQFHNSDE